MFGGTIASEAEIVVQGRRPVVLGEEEAWDEDRVAEAHQDQNYNVSNHYSRGRMTLYQEAIMKTRNRI